MSEKTDTKVIELFNLVREKQRLTKTEERPTFQTHCSFAYDTSSSKELRKNIHTIQSVEELLEIYAFLKNKQANITSAAKELDLSVKITHLEYSIPAWLSDIKTRIKQLEIQNEKKKLQKLEAQLDGLISVEQRREMELEAIQKELGSI